MKIRLGFVSNSSSSSFVITENKLDEIYKATDNDVDIIEVKDIDRESLLHGIIRRAQENIDSSWDVDESIEKINRANYLLEHPEVKIYLTGLISDGYWTDGLFFDDPEVIEYAESHYYHGLVPYEGQIEIFGEDCISNRFDISSLENEKHKKVLIDIFNCFNPEDKVIKDVNKLNFTYISQDVRKIICDLYNEFKNLESN